MLGAGVLAEAAVCTQDSAGPELEKGRQPWAGLGEGPQMQPWCSDGQGQQAWLWLGSGFPSMEWPPWPTVLLGTLSAARPQTPLQFPIETKQSWLQQGPRQAADRHPGAAPAHLARPCPGSAASKQQEATSGAGGWTGCGAHNVRKVRVRLHALITLSRAAPWEDGCGPGRGLPHGRTYVGQGEAQ